MTLERRNPLPAGKYWQDVFDPNTAKFTAWTTLNRGKVRVTSSEHFEANAGGPARDFVVFEVLEPVSWPQKELGFPTINATNVQSSEDTVDRPPPEKDFLDTINPAGDFAAAKLLLTFGLLTAVGVGVAYIASNVRSK